MNTAQEAGTTGGLEGLGWDSVRQNLRPILVAALIVGVVGIVVVLASLDVWRILGVGRGLVPEAMFPVSGGFVLLATTYGQFVGWAVGWALLGFLLSGYWPGGEQLVKVSMSVVLVGLGALPVVAYTLLAGGPLAGLPRMGLEAWLAQAHPSAHLWLVTLHPVVNALPPILTLVALGYIWKFGRGLFDNRNAMTVFLTVVMLVSFFVALSLGQHAALARVRIGF